MIGSDVCRNGREALLRKITARGDVARSRQEAMSNEKRSRGDVTGSKASPVPRRTRGPALPNPGRPAPSMLGKVDNLWSSANAVTGSSTTAVPSSRFLIPSR